MYISVYVHIHMCAGTLICAIMWNSEFMLGVSLDSYSPYSLKQGLLD